MFSRIIISKRSTSLKLVNIPVRLYTISNGSQEFSFNLLNDKGIQILVDERREC
jgi:non-homologous end joining protein Ku